MNQICTIALAGILSVALITIFGSFFFSGRTVFAMQHAREVPRCIGSHGKLMNASQELKWQL